MRRSMWMMMPVALLLLLLLAYPGASPLLCVNGEGVDDRTYDSVSVSIAADGVGPSYFTDLRRNFTAEFRDGLVSFLGPDGPGSLAVSDATFPLASVRRVTTAQPNRTVWEFEIHYVAMAASTYPKDVYDTLAGFCDRQLDGSCVTLSSLQGYSADVPARQWLFLATAVSLRCCDGSLVAELQSCPVCGARDWLPVILGCVLGFVGGVAVLVAIVIFCRRGKKRKAARSGISDAGHRPPPANIGPAFDVQKPKQPPPQMQSQQQQEWQQWQQQQQQPQLTTPYYLAQNANGGGAGGASGGPPRVNPTSSAPPAGPVVVKVSSADGKKRTARKDEPDASSSPITDVNAERDDRRKRKDKK